MHTSEDSNLLLYPVGVAVSYGNDNGISRENFRFIVEMGVIPARSR